VRRWLLTASPWQYALLYGGLFFVAMTLDGRFVRQESWTATLVGAAIGGAVVGAGIGPLMRRKMKQQLDAVGDVPDDVRYRVAGRSTLRGPLPTDPDERAAQVRLIDHQLAQVRRGRPVAVVVYAVFVAAGVWLAVSRSPWWWLFVAFWLALDVLQLITPTLLHRRAARLRAGY